MKKFKTTCRVIYGDTDKMGMAYHANYFRWFEMGRSETFRALGFSYLMIEKKGYVLPVSKAYCDYKSPVLYDDLITIETSIDPSVKGGIKFLYTIFCDKEKKIFATGYTKHACLNSNGKVVRPPEFLRHLIAKSIA